MDKYSYKQLITFFSGIFGFLFGMVPFLIGYLLGTGIEFDKARASNEFARTVQVYHQIIFWILSAIFLISVAGFVGYYIYHIKNENIKTKFKNPIFFPYVRIIASLCAGYLIYELVIYLLINGIYYHGAFVSIPYLIGIGITFGVCIMVLSDAKFMAFLYQRVFKGKQNITATQKNSLNYIKIGKNLCVLLLGLIFMIPSIAPMMGVTPHPNIQPETGYGSTDRPYSVTKIRIENQLPEDIASYVLPDNVNETWYTYIYLPNLAEETFTITPQVPIAFYLHGYGGSNHLEYDMALRTLASRGMAVIFVQYATDLNVDTILTDLENGTTTNGADYYVRYNMTWNGMRIAADALTGNNSLINQEDLTEILGDSYVIDFSRILILGHSYGGGMTIFMGPQVLNQGWATNQLVIDLAAPWYTSTWTAHKVDLAILPNYTIVNVVGYEDDSTASPCIGMRQFERFYSRDDSIPLNSTQVSYLYIQSDRSGFPRLVATHYLPNDALANTLTYYGYYRRIDAMAGFLIADAQNQTINALDALTYFTSGGANMVEMGKWSDGTPIKPLLYSIDPYGIREGSNLTAFVLNPDHAMCQNE